MDGAPGSLPLSADTLARMADALAWPLLLLAPDGRLLHANLEARQLLQDKQLLGLTKDGLVQPVNRAARHRFAQTLGSAAAGNPMLLQCPGDTHGTIAVIPIKDTAGEAMLLMALTLTAAGRADSTAFAALHGLSPAEARVLQRLALGDSPARAAEVLGVSVATVRSQSVTIRRKTGHSSMAQLVNAVANGSPLSAALTSPAQGSESTG